MAELLDNASHRDERFSRLQLAGATLTGAQFESCVFDRCSFAGATFHRCRFIDCRFLTCDLGNVLVPNSHFAGTHFERCKLVGVDFTHAGASEAARLMLSFSFDGCMLDYASFFGLRLRDLQMTGCHAHSTDFTEADLSGADLSRSDLVDAAFSRAVLEHATLTGATGYAIDPTVTRVKGARFSLPEAMALLRPFDVVIEP